MQRYDHIDVQLIVQQQIRGNVKELRDLHDQFDIRLAPDKFDLRDMTVRPLTQRGGNFAQGHPALGPQEAQFFTESLHAQ